MHDTIKGSFLFLNIGSSEKNMQDNIHENALPQFAIGIRKAANAVGKTMGAAGVNVVLESKLNPRHILVNDGSTIVEAMELADPIQNIGLSFLKEAVARSNANSGDGSSSTTILLSKILDEGIKSGVSTLEIKRSLEECLPIIEESLKKQIREITTDGIKAVAIVAGEDEEVATILKEIYEKIGKDGIIHLENSGTFETNYSLIEGVRFIDTGYLSSDLVSDEEAEKRGEKPKRAIYNNPTILVTKNKVEHDSDLNPLLSALIARGDKTLVIFTSDMVSDVAKRLIALQKEPKRSINILIIKAPWLWKGYVYEDLAKLTGATIIEDSTGTSLGNKFRLDWLGTCGTIICDKDETTLVGTRDISDHKKDLEADGSADSKLRLSWLNTKTAILKLGAKSETELSWRRYKTEDAIFSSRSSLHHGIVAGGGIALLNCIKDLPDTIGGNILKEALKAPLTQIIANAGSQRTFDEATRGESVGFNAKTGEVVDMFQAGIVDSADIVRNAVRNSLGIAASMLTTSSVIVLPSEKEKKDSPFPFV